VSNNTNQNLNHVDERSLELAKIKKEMLQSLENYNRAMTIMQADAPIAVLGVHKRIERILLREGITRIYELVNLDLTKIEWLDDVFRRELTASLDKFMSML